MLSAEINALVQLVKAREVYVCICYGGWVIEGCQQHSGVLVRGGEPSVVMVVIMDTEW